ncbi:MULTISPECIES: hypothetical protein [unclassified Treponema]|uniref:hypothetical protein n=1 Tax=unclassified Treponema TaxID=2638727 RepID=UPI0020A57BA2|nr:MULTISPECIES: hypothetical protein [unclassified Treponema]UTC68427.1 hypothetical protein E4O06_07295 [Treponema sp. OMZ 789]UTC68570.1 hypothetical protein E4O01_07435 [Treponema sp. OMZ 790]UTC71300.1 hypothetical protein E4O02_07625 [Treponema sp. OMZ 791]
MARQNTRKQTTFGIRLLIILFILFFYSAYAHAGIEEDINLSFSSSPLFIDSVFEVKIKLDETSLYYYKSSDIPKLIILDESEALEFLDSGISSLYGGILITNKYKLKKIGNFELIPYLSLGNYQTKLNTFSIKVEPPALSTDTMFKWKILEADTYSSVKEIVQGKKYLIVLIGFFYDHFRDAGKSSVLDVNCRTPENSILEEADALKMNNSAIEETGWRAVSYFFWTPLKAGKIGLPAPQISIASESKVSRKIYVREQIVTVTKGFVKPSEESDEEKKALESLKPALTVKNNSAAQNDSDNYKKDFEEKISKAEMIAEMRTKEAGLFFTGQIKNKRLEYEKELNLKDGFPVRSSIFKKGLWVVFFILSVAEIYFFIFFKKKNMMTKIFLMGGLILISVFIFFYSGQYERAVYRPTDRDEEPLVYHIPEKNGTVVSSLKIGETVIIKQKTSEWFFIEKKDGTGGWQKRCEFIISD